MMFAWMFGASVLATLLGVAALSSEHAMRAASRAGRWPWAFALAAALIWPAIAGPVSRAVASLQSQPVVVAAQSTQSMSAVVIGTLPSVAEVWRARLDMMLLAAWIVVSAIMLLRLLVAARALKRLEKNGREAKIDGELVLITEQLGPAVVGVLSPQIAVPAWLTELDQPLRALVLRHEREHCLTRDPQLIWLAAIAVAVMPWNPAVWWMSRRLRLALEVDCDARTLDRADERQLYGKLLLLIAQRQSETHLAPMLAESNSHLAHRINAMKKLPVTRPVTRIAILVGVAAGAIAIACSPRLATDLTAPRSVTPDVSKTKTAGDVYFEFQVDKPVGFAVDVHAPKYPESLKANHVEGTVLVQYVVSAAGLPELSTFKILQSTDSLFSQAVADALPTMRFTPAMKGGNVVKQLVQQPFQFSLADTRNVVAQTPTIRANDGTTAPLRSAPDNGVHRLAQTTIAPVTGGTLQRSLNPDGTQAAYKEFQIEKPATLRMETAAMLYPELLKKAGVEGQVLAQFVVDEKGMPDVASFKVLQSDNALFTKAVRDALPNMRFEPALVGGKAVKQLMQSPFQFSLSR